MANYATRQELIDRFESEEAAAHVTNNPGGSPDDDVLDESLETAEAFIHTYLSMRYDIPVDVSSDTSLAALMKGATLDLAQWQLLSNHALVPESMQKVYERLMKWLDDLSKGKAVLPTDDATPAPTASRSPGIVYSFADRQFTRDNVSRL